MEAHYNLSDQQFALQFANGTLPGAWFTHQAHLRLAWIHIKRDGLRQAMQRIGGEIVAFAHLHGDPHKYHHTLTLAAIQVVHHFMNKTDHNDFNELIKCHPVLVNSFKSLILSHYSEEVIFSKAAKKSYLSPDLLPFDDIIDNQQNIVNFPQV